MIVNENIQIEQLKTLIKTSNISFLNTLKKASRKLEDINQDRV